MTVQDTFTFTHSLFSLAALAFIGTVITVITCTTTVLYFVSFGCGWTLYKVFWRKN